MESERKKLSTFCLRRKLTLIFLGFLVFRCKASNHSRHPFWSRALSLFWVFLGLLPEKRITPSSLFHSTRTWSSLRELREQRVRSSLSIESRQGSTRLVQIEGVILLVSSWKIQGVLGEAKRSRRDGIGTLLHR